MPGQAVTPRFAAEDAGQALGLLLYKTAKLAPFLLNAKELGGDAARSVLHRTDVAGGVSARIKAHKSGRDAGKYMAEYGVTSPADLPKAMRAVEEGAASKAKWRESLDVPDPTATRSPGLTPQPPKPKSRLSTWMDKHLGDFDSEQRWLNDQQVIKKERAVYT